MYFACFWPHSAVGFQLGLNKNKNEKRDGKEITRTVNLKKSVFSASIVPFTVMLPDVLSIANNPSSLPDHGKKRIKKCYRICET